MIIGDNGYSHDNIDVYAEGVKIVYNVGVSPEVLVERVYSANVSADQLNLKFVDNDGFDITWVLNMLMVEAVGL